MSDWMRLRFGPKWKMHVLWNVGVAWLLVVGFAIVNTRLAFVVGVVALLSTLNTGLLFVVRWRAERLGILAEVDKWLHAGADQGVPRP